MRSETLHILLADDDEGDRFLFLQAIQELNTNTDIHTVNDGKALMTYLNAADSTVPDFLFLDLRMPRKNGVECLQEIRSNKKFDRMFVAVYSTSERDLDMEETFLNDANIYIIKPVDFSLIKEMIGKALSKAFEFLDPPFDKSRFVL